MNVNAREQLLQCLQELGDRDFQERVWIRGEGPEVSSFEELVCQLFDDTGLGDMLASGDCEPVLGSAACGELRHLHDLLEGLPPGIGPSALLQLREWEAVVVTATRAAALVPAGAVPKTR